MNCDICGEWMDEYLDGVLPDDVRTELESHVAACAGCRAELEACRRLGQNLKQLPIHIPPAQVCLRVSEAIHAETPRARRSDFGPVLDLDELADYLRVDKKTVGQYVGDIPCFELGGRLLFRKAKVEEWIAGRETVVDFRSDWPAVQKWNVSDNATKGDVSWVLAQKN